MGERGRASAPGSARAAQSEQRQLRRAMQGIKRTRLALWDDAAVVAARSRRGTAFPRSLAQTRRARAATAALDSTFSACRRARRAASQRVRRGLGPDASVPPKRELMRCDHGDAHVVHAGVRLPVDSRWILRPSRELDAGMAAGRAGAAETRGERRAGVAQIPRSPLLSARGPTRSSLARPAIFAPLRDPLIRTPMPPPSPRRKVGPPTSFPFSFSSVCYLRNIRPPSSACHAAFLPFVAVLENFDCHSCHRQYRESAVGAQRTGTTVDRGEGFSALVCRTLVWLRASAVDLLHEIPHVVQISGPAEHIVGSLSASDERFPR